MIKLIVQMAKIIIISILTLLMTSCINFNTTQGSGNVVKTKRNVTNFTSIHAKTGLDIILNKHYTCRGRS